MVKLREVGRNACWKVQKGWDAIHLRRQVKNKIPRQEEMSTGKASESHCCGFTPLMFARCLRRSVPLWRHTSVVPTPSYPTYDKGLHRSFCHSALILQCLSNKYHVLHKLLYVTVGSQLQSGKDSPAEAKLSWSCGTWYEEQMRCYNHAESKEMTDYKYSSSCTVLKHWSRNLSKNPHPCLRRSKLTRHIKCIYFCIGLPTALSPWSFSSHTPSPSYFPPRSLQGRDLCDSTCFQRHSGITAHRLQES